MDLEVEVDRFQLTEIQVRALEHRVREITVVRHQPMANRVQQVAVVRVLLERPLQVVYQVVPVVPVYCRYILDYHKMYITVPEVVVEVEIIPVLQ
jgi:hypothetical protein